MSPSYGGITTSVGNTTSRFTAGSTTNTPVGAGSTTPPTATPDAFTSSFQHTLAGVLNDAASGVYDNPRISSETQRLLARISSRQAMTGASTVAVGGGPIAPSGTGETSTAGTDRADAADQRRLLVLQARQDQYRLTHIAAAMARQYPQAAAMASLIGAPKSVLDAVPTDDDGAKAFAQRLTMDLVNSAAAVDLAQSELQIAQIDAHTSPSTAATKALAGAHASYTQANQDYNDLVAAYEQHDPDDASALLGDANGSDPNHVAARANLAADGQQIATTGHSALTDTLIRDLTNNLLQMIQQQAKDDAEDLKRQENEQTRLDKASAARRQSSNREAKAVHQVVAQQHAQQTRQQDQLRQQHAQQQNWQEQQIQAQASARYAAEQRALLTRALGQNTPV